MLRDARGEYERHGPLILGVLWTEASLATVLIAFRIYAAVSLVKRLYWDLVWVLVAWSIACAAQGVLAYAVLIGAEAKDDHFTAHQNVEFSKWAIVQECIVSMSIAFGRVAVISFLLHLQERITTRARYFLHAVWVTNIVMAVLQVAFILTECTPVSFLWTQWDQNASSIQGTADGSGQCRQLKPEIAALINGIVGALSDLLLATYPVVLFWSWNMPLRRKIGLCVLMGGGVFCAAAGSLKFYYLMLVRVDGDVLVNTSYTLLNIWADTEMWFVIIFGSIPHLRLVAKHIRERVSKDKLQRHSVATSTDPLHYLNAHERRNLSRHSLTRRIEVVFGSALDWTAHDDEPTLQPEKEKQALPLTNEAPAVPEDSHVTSVRASLRSFSFVCQWPDDTSEVVRWPPIHEGGESAGVQVEKEDV